MRYGLAAVGTMAHSYVLSFPDEGAAFRAFLEDFPDTTILLVDTYDSTEGVRAAIAASKETGIALQGIRLDSGDLLGLSREARRLLDEAGMSETTIAASGDLDESRVADLVAAEAPIDLWGVGTDLGTSRDSPVVNGVYKIVADRSAPEGSWRGVFKRSPDKATVPGAKQVLRRYENGVMAGDTIAALDEAIEGEPLLVPAMRDGEPVLDESLETIAARSAAQLAAVPERLRRLAPGTEPEPYPVAYSPQLSTATALTSARRRTRSAGPPTRRRGGRRRPAGGG
jgi:nicotinate phosphoribosyltransferase